MWNALLVHNADGAGLIMILAFLPLTLAGKAFLGWLFFGFLSFVVVARRA
jgi:hypothetical protein